VYFTENYAIFVENFTNTLQNKMAKFTPCVRNKRSDGFYPVYIRVFHNNSIQYIKTDSLVGNKGLKTVYDAKGKKSMEISDKRVLKICLDKIQSYVNIINNLNHGIKDLECKEFLKILEGGEGELSFTKFMNEYILSMKNDGRDSAKIYNTALNDIKKYFGRENILFNELTSINVQGWIDTMKGYKRKNSLYPVCVKAVFNAAVKKYNDYDYNIIRIRVNPFIRTEIPGQLPGKKRSVPVDVLKKIFSAKITPSENHKGISRIEIARDVSLMVFCLAGINAADLYDLKKTALKKNWKLCYDRKKTRERSGGAYTEITVPEIIRPLFEKYNGAEDSLFVFSKRYSTPSSFVKNVNEGLHKISADLGVEEKITTYVFRHSWATIAQNECDASTEQVAFALTHASEHKVTENYIRKDYSPIDDLNQRVLSLVFK
jgi:site-specific recombinase XerD